MKAKAILLFFVLMSLFVSCGREDKATSKQSTDREVHKQKPTRSTLKPKKEDITRNDCTHSAADNSHIVPIARAAGLFDRMLGTSNANADGEVTLDDLTGKQLQQLIDSFEVPWEADKLLWDQYVNSTDNNKLAVAEVVFRYMIKHYDDPRTQAYARDHLGRVLEKRGDLRNALQILESVELQPDGEDFWYVAAKEEAGDIAYRMLSNATDKREKRVLYDKSENNFNKALERIDDENIQATIYYKVGHLRLNHNYQTAYDSFKSAHHLYLKAKNVNGARMAMEDMKRTEDLVNMFGANDF